MAEQIRHIYWRPEIESFLPLVDEQEISELLISEFSRHARGLEAGTIISQSVFCQTYLTRVEKNGKTSFKALPNPNDVCPDTDSTKLTNDFLRELLGPWVSHGFIHQALWKLCGVKLEPTKELKNPGQILMINEENKANAVDTVLAELKKRHEKVDAVLKRYAETLVEDDLLKENADELLQKLFCQIVNESGSGQDYLDRWFCDTCEEVSFFFETLGLSYSPVAAEDIAEKYFSSWVPPDDSQVVKFADEISAILLRQVFDDKYVD